MKKIHRGSTSVWFPVKIVDPRTSPQKGLTGVLASGGTVVVAYSREGAASVDVPIHDADAGSAWGVGAWVEADPVLSPGIYWVGLPNAAFAAGARRVVVSVTGSTVVANGGHLEGLEFADCDFEVEIDALPYQDPKLENLTVSNGGRVEIDNQIPNVTS